MTPATTDERRQPAVAGRFYPGTKRALRSTVAKLMPENGDERALALMAPHAGYVYSGRTAGKVFGRVDVPDRVIIMSPNHTGRGYPLAMWSRGSWLLPTGEVPVDEELAERLIASHSAYRHDPAAHTFEHGIEVELPFLHARNPNIKVVGIVISGLDIETLITLGEAMADVITDLDERVLIVASSDMSHFISAERAAVLDRLALDRFEAIDARGLFQVVEANHITMCGYMPATVTLAAAKRLGATSSEVIDYTHSGVVTGDHSSVVGYAAAIVS